MTFRLSLVAVLAVLSACKPTEPTQQWKIWNATQIAERAALKTDDGGYGNMLGATGLPARDLATIPGFAPPFRGYKYGDSVSVLATVGGPAILPAFAEGGTAAYFVSDVWQNAPLPFVQPVYVWVRELVPNAPGSARLTLSSSPGDVVPAVFGVGPNSAFMSPYWQAHFVVPRKDETIGFDTAKDVSGVLAHADPEKIYPGPLVGCPIVPEGVDFAGDRGFRPLSLEPVKQLPLGPAWATLAVSTAIVPYVDVGGSAYQVNDRGQVLPTRIYTFVTGDLDKPRRLPLPAVLAADARENALADRIDVWLNPADMEVFLPASADWGEARTELLLLGFGVPTPGPSIPPALEKSLLLRVAKRGEGMAETEHCFDSLPSLSGSCHWLDSEAAIQTHLEGPQLLSTNTRMSVWPLLYNGAIP